MVDTSWETMDQLRIERCHNNRCLTRFTITRLYACTSDEKACCIVKLPEWISTLPASKCLVDREVIMEGWRRKRRRRE